MAGWVKIHRTLLGWEWYSDIPVKVLFLHLLLSANHEDKNWRGTVVGRGQIVTGRDKLSDQTGLTQRQIRTALNKLKTTGEVTIRTTSKFSIITICNYSKYQESKTANDQQDDQQNDQQETNKGPAIDHKQEVKNLRTKEEKPKPLSDKPDDHEKTFADFWALWPKGKRQKRKDALKVWMKIKPTGNLLNKIMSAVEAVTKTEDWTKENGKYIPGASVWLNGERWEDEIGTTTTPATDEFIGDPDFEKKVNDYYAEIGVDPNEY